ncbi:PEP-CTERM sorting domain-containing protein [Massilia sp. SYSU DXS3249]
MFKKVLAVIVTALACNSASAGFIQYDVDARFSDGTSLDGFFVQDTNDKAIAYYELFANGSEAAPATWYSPSGLFANILSAHRNFYHAGPTSFTLFSDLSDAYYATLELSFRMGANGGVHVAGSERTTPYSYAAEWGAEPSWRRIVGGNVTLGEIDAGLLASLEAGENGGLEHIVPTPMPEPGSLALLAIGILGAAGMRRRRPA